MAKRGPKRTPQSKKSKAKRKAPMVGGGRGKPQVSRKAKRVAHGFVAASGAPSSSVADDGIGEVSDKGVRLNRWLAEQGVDSRRKCDDKIFSGEVAVNGTIVDTPGYRVQPEDEVTVNGARIRITRRLYYLFYKPRGVLCTNDPRETRTRLCDLVDPMVPSRVYPIGRLDEESEGLILLTNDGDFSNLVAHPSFGIEKTYVCQIGASMGGEELDRLRAGAWIDGIKVIPKNVRVIRRLPKSTMMEISISEGRNREIRRLLARFGLNVQRLKRVRIGALTVKGIKRGMLRPLTREERDQLVTDARSEKVEESVEVDGVEKKVWKGKREGKAKGHSTRKPSRGLKQKPSAKSSKKRPRRGGSPFA